MAGEDLVGAVGARAGGSCGVNAAAAVMKRGLLADMERRHVLFGFENKLDYILQQLVTFLNGRCVETAVRRAFVCVRVFIADSKCIVCTICSVYCTVSGMTKIVL